MINNTLRTGGQPIADEPLQVPTVRLIDCQGLTYALERASSSAPGLTTHPVATKYEALPVTGGVITLFYPDGTRAAMIEFPYNGPVDITGFEVVWESKFDCSIIRKSRPVKLESDSRTEKSVTRPVPIPKKEVAPGGGSPGDKPCNSENLPFDGKGLITFINCKDYQTMLLFRGQTVPKIQPIPSLRQEVRVRFMEYELFALNGTKELTIDLTDPRHVYRKGNFEVRKITHSEWEVIYKPSFTSRIVDFFTSKLGLGLILLLVILGGGAWIYSALLSGPAERMLYVSVDNGEKVSGIEVVKDGEKGMRTSGNTLAIQFKGDTLKFSGVETVRIDFGPEGKTTDIRVMDLVGKQDYVFRTETDSVKVTSVKTPAAELYATIIADEQIDTVKVEAFRSMFADSKHNQDLTERVTALKVAESAAAAREDELKKVRAEYDALIAKLGNMNVTKADLDKVIAFQNEHKDELKDEIAKNRAKVNAYRKFFDPGQSFARDIKYFSPAQQRACLYYLNYMGNDTKRDFKYALEKAKEKGLY